EASAGTGKTYTITSLYLRLILGRGAERAFAVNEILVLTFTIAATAELKHRIRTRLMETRLYFLSRQWHLRSGDADDSFHNADATDTTDTTDTTDAIIRELFDQSQDVDRDIRLLTASIALLDDAAIFTIHGFCSRVLSDYAFETGTLFDQQVDPDPDVMLTLAVEDCYRSELMQLSSPVLEIAQRMWPTPTSLQRQIRQFIYRDGIEVRPDERTVDLSRYRTLAGAIKHMWVEQDIPSILREAGFIANRRCLTHIDEMTRFCGDTELDGRARSGANLWELWTNAHMQRHLKKSGHLPNHPIFDHFDELWGLQHEFTQLKANLWHQVLGNIKERLSHQQTALGILTLDDLLSRVATNLNETRLARRLADRWPIAMIDEFQDTDDTQYQIFKRIYIDAHAPGTAALSNTMSDGASEEGASEDVVNERALFMIGDPKQAIYQFRGADVYTYINARRQTAEQSGVHSLTVNYRSTPPLVDAINHLFNQPNVFDNDDDMPFVPVDPGLTEQDVLIRGENVPPVVIRHFTGHDGKGLQAPEATMLATEWVAEEIAANLLHPDTTIDGEPLHAGQIAVLVRDKNHARATQQSLARRQIQSVYLTLESVFLTETATDLMTVLEAVLDPGDERKIRAALASPLLASTAEELARLGEDTLLQQDTLTEFQRYHSRWAQVGIAPMIESLIKQRGVAARLLQTKEGERQLTNLRHLTELMQERSMQAPGMHRLVKWYARERQEALTVAPESHQLRLESDQNLVKLVTMHAAKGLEYDIVLIPIAGFGLFFANREPHLYHDLEDDRYRLKVDIGGSDTAAQQANTESMSEDMRLLYVAATRARLRCYLGMPHTRDARRTAFARLLGYEGKRDMSDVFNALPEKLFDTGFVTETERTLINERRNDAAHLTPPEQRPAMDQRWQVHSYTGITRLLAAHETETDQPGYSDDDVQTAQVILPGEFTPNARAPDPMDLKPNRFTFPRGPRAGIALHSLFESLVFDQPLAQQHTLLQQCLERVGLVREQDIWEPVLKDWCEDILGSDLQGMKLRDISRANRIDEMEFHFPVHASYRVFEFLQDRGYVDGLRSREDIDISGLMTGLVDLTFRHDGCYFIVDYKSNHLGPAFPDYEQSALNEAMDVHQYRLQYLIYTVAMTRHLRYALPTFDYDQQFGGVYYLFLRGMNAEDNTGIYFDKPPADDIEALDALLNESGERDVSRL
ncbi:MAG: exodeoxyribonuclease V subunit beta, partial [Pseudomonadota bacterium]